MSTGLHAIKAIIREGDTTAFRELGERLFTDEELPAFNFVRGYHRLHGQLPGLDVVAENGIEFPGKASGAVSHYVQRLQDRALYTEAAPDVTELMAAMEERNLDGLREITARLASKLRDRDTENPVTNIGREAQDLLVDLRNRGQFYRGITTGYPTLDINTGGLTQNDFLTLAGRTNVGKSYLLLHMSTAAWAAMNSCLIITMEMGVRQLTTRMVGMGSGINTKFIRERRVTSYKMDDLAETVLDFQLRPPLHFVSGHKLTGVEDVETLIHEMHPAVCYIDAAYLFKLADRGKRGKWEMLEDVMEALQAIMVRTKTPIVITVQLGKGQSSRSSSLDNAIDKVRGSDAISQLSSILVAVAAADGIHRQTRRVMNLAKNREGPKEVEWWSKFEFDPMDFSETANPTVERRTQTTNAMASSQI